MTEQKMQTYKLFNVELDLDDIDHEDDFTPEIPEQITLPVFENEDIDDQIAEAISDITGYCVNSFNYEKVGE